MMNGAVWIPLVFLFQFRAARGDRPVPNAALSGMFLGIAFPQRPPSGPDLHRRRLGRRLALPRPAGNRRLVVPAALAVLFAFLAGALQTLPAYEYGHLAQRWVGAPEPIAWDQPVPYFVHAHYDLKAFSLFGIVFPGVKMHFDPFLGVVALSLALLAVAACWRDSRVRLLAALAGRRAPLLPGPQQRLSGLALCDFTPNSIRRARPPPSSCSFSSPPPPLPPSASIDSRPVIAGSAASAGSWSVFGAVDPRHFAQAALFSNKLVFPADDRIILTGVIALLAAALFSRPPCTPVARLSFCCFSSNSATPASTTCRPLRSQSDAVARQDLRQCRCRRIPPQQPGFQRTEVAADAFAPNWGAWHGVEMHGGKSRQHRHR